MMAQDLKLEGGASRDPAGSETPAPADGASSVPVAEDNEALYRKLLAELKAEFPDHLPLLLEHLKKVRGV